MAFDLAKDPKDDRYQRGIAPMVYKLFDKKFPVAVLKMKIFIFNLYFSPFMDNNWGAYLEGMHLISKFNKRFRFLLCFIDIYSKYVSFILLNDKKGITISNAFQKTLNKWNSEFCNRPMKSFFQSSNIEMHLTHNKENRLLLYVYVLLKESIWLQFQNMFLLIH